MPSVVHPLAKPVWLDRFVLQVGRLLPASDPDRASWEADAIFDAASDLAPEEAARIWISVPLPDGLASFY